MKNSEEVIYFDESGSTEKGITDHAQLFITFASVFSTEKLCKLTLEKEFSPSSENEIKYNDLGVGRDKTKIISTLLEFKQRGGKVKTYCVYKPLFLFHSLLKCFYEDSINFIGGDQFSGSADSEILRLHNYWFNCIIIHGEEFLTNLIFYYQDLVFNTNQENYEKLYKLTEEKQNICFVSRMIFFCLKSSKLEGVRNLLETRNDIMGDKMLWIDPVINTTGSLLSRWYFDIKKPLTVIHDESYPLKIRKEILDHICNSSYIPPVQSEINKNLMFHYNSFKLAKDIEFPRSNDYYGLQIADLFAGFVNEVVKKHNSSPTKEIKTCFEHLIEIIEVENFIHMIPDQSWVRHNIPYEHLLKNKDSYCKASIINCIKSRR